MQIKAKTRYNYTLSKGPKEELRPGRMGRTRTSSTPPAGRSRTQPLRKRSGGFSTHATCNYYAARRFRSRASVPESETLGSRRHLYTIVESGFVCQSPKPETSGLLLKANKPAGHSRPAGPRSAMRRSELTLRARRLCQEPRRVEMAGPERNILEMTKP